MIVKATLLFLVAMLALGVFGKLRAPRLRRRGSRDNAVQAASKCSVCDAFVIGTTSCGRPDCPRGGADRSSASRGGAGRAE